MLEQLENMTIPQCKNSSLQSISREVDLAWLAGIVDGEGNIMISDKIASNGKRYFMPKVRISNTDIRMIKKISEIYTELNIVFFYTINKRKRYNDRWKDQLHIEVASQGSVKKLLRAVLDYLVNKRDMARIILQMIDFVQSQRKGGRLTSKDKLVDYVNLPEFIAIKNQYETEKKFYVDPSTTKRRASKVVTW